MIIGLVGTIGSGKDTVADMLRYILFAKSRQIDVTYAEYLDYLEPGFSNLDIDANIEQHSKLFAFGDALKEAVSTIYGIPKHHFYNRDAKDNLYYSLTDDKFKSETEILGKPIVTRIADETVQLITKPGVWFKLRSLLQYFGTDVCRNRLNPNIWITALVAKLIHDDHDIRIVTDIRFINELYIVDMFNPTEDSLSISVINTSKFANNDTAHVSETEQKQIYDRCTTNVIWNGKNKEELFISVKLACCLHIDHLLNK